MKKKNLGLTIGLILVAVVIVASLAITIWAGVIALISNNGEETTTAPSEQTQDVGEDNTNETTTPGGNESGNQESSESDNNPYGTTEVVDELGMTETVLGEEITENDD